MMGRQFVIGDIHGAFKALEQLMQKINPQKEDQFIFLGDYVDGWSQSAEIISWLIRFSRDHDSVFLRGNHDEDCRQWLQSGEIKESWLAHGGEATLESYHKLSAAEQQQHLEFFHSLKYYFADNSNRLFVHAGFANRRGPKFEHHESNFFWDRTLWETALALNPSMPVDSVFYPKRLLLFSEIYIGHTPTTGYNSDTPMNAANVWNIDTGAAFYGKLSAIEINSKDILQSDPVYQLYPDEMGRNSLT